MGYTPVEVWTSSGFQPERLLSVNTTLVEVFVSCQHRQYCHFCYYCLCTKFVCTSTKRRGTPWCLNPGPIPGPWSQVLSFEGVPPVSGYRFWCIGEGVAQSGPGQVYPSQDQDRCCPQYPLPLPWKDRGHEFGQDQGYPLILTRTFYCYHTCQYELLINIVTQTGYEMGGTPLLRSKEDFLVFAFQLRRIFLHNNQYIYFKCIYDCHLRLRK